MWAIEMYTEGDKVKQLLGSAEAVQYLAGMMIFIASLAQGLRWYRRVVSAAGA